MKRLLLTMMVWMCCSGIFGQTDRPEKLYLVGSMNQWITPDGGEAGLEYVLTDDNGDGWYTGSFQIESGELQFKIFSEIAGWGKEEAYFGSTSGSGMQLFAQAPTESDARNDGYG
ncbi:MAG: hypothetical protein K2H15_00130, partial [Muribaculaceae bacterium]|nr:hypothetical protein [Muribaculaceae bacterium]